jgi:hypothetical protein
MENESNNKAENIDSSNEKLLLSDAIESVCFNSISGDDLSYFNERSYNDWFEMYKKQTVL